GISLIDFIYNYLSTLGLWRHFPNEREFVRHVTFQEERRKEKDTTIMPFPLLSKEVKGQQATQIILGLLFHTFKIMALLVQVLHLNNGETKLAMG
ncbi:hypothetical protein CR513_43587, partial [Mucuna pruriens]